MTGNKPKGIGVLAAGGRVAAAQRAVRDMVTDGTGSVLACPWPVAELIGRWSESPAGRDLTPVGYRLVLVRPLEGELRAWRVERIIGTSGTGLLGPTEIGGETVGHVVIGRESAAPRSVLHNYADAYEDGLVYLVVS